ncbi:MAG: branched-chain amino acid ABC transporter permease [Desulfarculaceae bacterium]|jgi:branched-chain amino acid transport system permease protein
MEILIYGLINSASLALMALGFTLVYGICRLPNFAHGALYVLTGCAAWLLLHWLGLPYALALAAALVLIGLAGACLHRFIFARIRGMAVSEIMASYALGLALLEGLRWGGVRGSTFTLPAFAEGSLEIAGVVVDFQRLVLLGAGFLLVAALHIFSRYTRLGLALRAVAQDESAAQTLGIDPRAMGRIALALGAMLAGAAALVLLPLGSIVVEKGYSVLILGVAVCILGGLGSVGGALMAAALIGFAQTLTTAWLGSHFQMVIALAAIILTLVLRPSGLRGRQKELAERV